MKVGKFIFPADFVVLHMEEDHEVLLILGRPFLATGGALIHVQSRGFTLKVNGEDVNFNIYCTMKPDDKKVTCHLVESIGSHVVDTQLGLEPEVSWKVCAIYQKEDGLESKDEDHTHNLIAQEPQHKESTLGHVKGGWVQQVRNPPKFGLSKRLWCPKEKQKRGTPSTSIKKLMQKLTPPNST